MHFLGVWNETSHSQPGHHLYIIDTLTQRNGPGCTPKGWSRIRWDELFSRKVSTYLQFEVTKFRANFEAFNTSSFFFFDSTSGMGITAFYGSSMEDEDAVKLLQAAYDMGYRYHGITKKQAKLQGWRGLPFFCVFATWVPKTSPWVSRFRNASLNSWQLGGLRKVDDVLMYIISRVLFWE